jgi:outer membrane receptor protein involved in Fe transport
MRMSVAAAVVCLSIAGMTATAQVQAVMRQHTEIPPEPLDLALRTLAKQRGFQLVYVTESVASQMTRGAVGDFTVDEALKKILADTRLEYRFVDDNTVSIFPQQNSSTALGAEPAADIAKEGKNDSSGTFRVAQGPAAISTQVGQNPDAAQDTAALEEVVVTAQKRTERLQDVPVSVTAVSGHELEAVHATSLADYAAYVPSLQVISFLGQPGQVNLALRGITTGSTAANQSVAIYVDDVPVGSSSIYAGGGSSGMDLVPYDVERIEVLEGPQGTLYGASALGGLLKYVTKQPDLTQTEFRFGLDASDVYNATRAGYGLRASANVPLIPNELAFSVSASHAYTPGYIDNVATGEKSFNSGVQDSARLAALWRPSERFSVELSALYNRSPFNGAGYVAVNSAAGQPPLGRYDNIDVEPDSNNVTTQLYVARLRYDAGWASITSVSSFSRFNSFSQADGSSIFYPFFGVYAAFTTRSDVNKFTQEIRLASPEHQKFNWVTGVFFTNENASGGQTGLALTPGTNEPDPVFNPLIVTDEPSRFREVAAFGNGTYSITDAWDVSAGLRGSHNEQSVNETAYGSLFDATASDPAVTLFPDVSQNKVTYSASSSYHLTPDQMLYARIATGYRPGGANKIAPDAPPTFGPDTTTNYEAGIKSEWLGRRLLFNLTAFYIDWRDTQVTGVTPLGLTYISNAGAAVSKGMELTSEWTPLRGLTLGLNATYTDAYLTADAPGLGGVSGDPLPSTPKLSGSLTLHYERPVLQGFTGVLDGVWRYVGPRNTAFPGSTDIIGNYRLASYGTLDLSAGLSRNAWTARLFVRNATNRYTYLFVLPPGGPDSPTSNVIPVPRTIGLSVDVKY